MTKKKIKQLADFFYSSNSSNDIPLRISVVTGHFSGFDLSKESFSELFNILCTSVNIKKDLTSFLQKYE